MLRPLPLALLATLAGGLLASGCTFEGRTDGGSPRHTDNGALEAHREAVADANDQPVTEPLTDAPATSATPVPTPRMGTVSDGPAPAEPGAMAPPDAPTAAPSVPAAAPAQ